MDDHGRRDQGDELRGGDMNATCKDCAYWIATTSVVGTCKLRNGLAQLVGSCYWWRSRNMQMASNISTNAAVDMRGV